MEVVSLQQIEEVSALIGQQNVTATQKALKDGARVWVFKTIEEVRSTQELDGKEKEFCLKQFTSGEKWAGIFRPPVRFIPGFTTDANYDTHGNSRGGGGCCRGGCQWSH